MTGDHVSPPRRIAVIGTSGSGKTTFAHRIAATIAAPHIELDGLFHQPGWVPAEPTAFRGEVSRAIATPAWVTDGTYSGFLRDIVRPAADTLVWLDYPFRVVLWRLFRRTMSRGLRRTELWNGNTHWKHRREWPAVFRQQEMAHVRILRLRSPREAEPWLRELARRARMSAK